MAASSVSVSHGLTRSFHAFLLHTSAHTNLVKNYALNCRAFLIRFIVLQDLKVLGPAHHMDAGQRYQMHRHRKLKCHYLKYQISCVTVEAVGAYQATKSALSRGHAS